MSRKHLVVLAILGILVMILSVLGCQSYKAPTYKSPEATGEETTEPSADEGAQEVNIDVSDVSSEEEPVPEEVPAQPAVTKTPTIKPAATVKATTKTAEPAPVTETTESAADFKKAPYKPVNEENLPTLTVTEGQLARVNLKTSDPDGDKLTYEFTAPLNQEGEWQTRAGDAGVYYPEITVSDGKATVKKQIKLIVEPKNNKPVLGKIADITVNEGDTVSLSPKATDADGDKLTYTYSGWMTSNTKQVGYNEQGDHTVTVSVSDGISIVSQDVKVTVIDVNRPPTVEVEF